MSFILRIIKSLFNILLLSTLIALLFFWASLSEEARFKVAQKMNTLSPFDIFELSNKLKSTLKIQIDKSDNAFIQETASVLLSDSINNSDSHFNFSNIECSLPANKQLQKTKNHKIYQWTDEQGRVHFTDTDLQKAAQDISEHYPSRQEFITLNIQLIHSALPLDFSNTLQISTTKMFMVLSETLNIKQLHQLELGLKLFGQTHEFQDYLSEKAPQLKQAAGFYLAKENEASVLMQSNLEQSMGLIRHESSHVMMANLYGLSPIWLNEGFAEYFQGLKVSGFETSVYPNTYQLHLLRQAQQTNSLSLKKHFDLSVQEWQSQDIERHYAEAWSIVYFLLSNPEHKQLLAQYFAELSKSRCSIPNSAEFFQTYYPGGLMSMNSDWQHWLTQSEIYPHRY